MRSLRILAVAAAITIVAGCGGTNGYNGSSDLAAPAVTRAATEAPDSVAPTLSACDAAPNAPQQLRGSDLEAAFWMPRPVPVSADEVLSLDKTKPGQDAVSQLYNDDAMLRAWIANDDRAGIVVYTRVPVSTAGDPASEVVVLVVSNRLRYAVYLAPTNASACNLAGLINRAAADAQEWAPGSAHAGVQVQTADGRSLGGGTVLIGISPTVE